MQHLHVYPDENIPENILGNITSQIKQLRPVPIRYDHISQEEKDNFPLICKLPKEYVTE